MGMCGRCTKRLLKQCAFFEERSLVVMEPKCPMIDSLMFVIW